MKITRKLITISNFSRPATKLKAVKGIVLHWVASPKSDAIHNWNYFESLKHQVDKDPNPRYASAHFIVGLKGDCLQAIPTCEIAYHVGARRYRDKALAYLSSYPNDCTLGIELCHLDREGHFTEETLQTARELCALLCEQNKLDPKKALYRHYDITGKICPKLFVDDTASWEAFVQSVVDLM